MDQPSISKIVDQKNLRAIIGGFRKQGKQIVFTNGCFDLIHTGHTRYLSAARKAGDCLVVAVNSDNSVRRLKGDNRPIIPLEERMEILAALESVDYVVSFDESDPYGLIQCLQPTILVKGGDWPLENIIGRKLVEADGGRVFTIPEIKGRSTSSIIETIVQRYTLS